MNYQQLIQYMDDYLHINEISDYGPQGLQVETENATIQKVALAVDVSPQIIESVAEWGGDMLLVHHGIFWGGPQKIAGPYGERIRKLIQNGIHLYAAHLALDAHPEVGNNAILASMLQLQDCTWWANMRGIDLAIQGSIQPRHRDEIVQILNEKLGTDARLLPYGPDVAQRIGILSGEGSKLIPEAASLGIDTFVTGETSHSNYWLASDYGINVIYAGHYASETVGVKALGDHISKLFQLETKFFDFPTGM